MGYPNKDTEEASKNFYGFVVGDLVQFPNSDKIIQIVFLKYVDCLKDVVVIFKTDNIHIERHHYGITSLKNAKKVGHIELSTEYMKVNKLFGNSTVYQSIILCDDTIEPEKLDRLKSECVLTIEELLNKITITVHISKDNILFEDDFTEYFPELKSELDMKYIDNGVMIYKGKLSINDISDELIKRKFIIKL
jgi:hypothetical protein